MFSKGGTFAGRSFDEVVESLRSGAMKTSELPIDYLVRDSRTVILNTRSSHDLESVGHVAIGAAVGCGAGIAAPIVASKLAGAALLGGFANAIQYSATTLLDGCDPTITEEVESFLFGAAGGLLGGRFQMREASALQWTRPG